MRRRRRAAVLAPVLALALIPAPPATASPLSAGCDRVELVGHRGTDVGFAENTLRAFRSAVRNHADRLELDVRWTSDGVPVVLHDPTLDRTTDGHGPVARRSWAEVSRLRTGDGQRVPALREVVALAAAAGVGLQVELKSVPGQRRVSRVAALLRGAAMRRATVVTAFEMTTLRRYHRADPGQALALISFAAVQAGQLPRLVDWILYDRVVVTPELIRRAHASGRLVGVWVANGAADWSRFLPQVDAIATDRIRALDAWCERR